MEWELYLCNVDTALMTHFQITVSPKDYWYEESGKKDVHLSFFEEAEWKRTTNPLGRDVLRSTLPTKIEGPTLVNQDRLH